MFLISLPALNLERYFYPNSPCGGHVSTNFPEKTNFSDFFRGGQKIVTPGVCPANSCPGLAGRPDHRLEACATVAPSAPRLISPLPFRVFAGKIPIYKIYIEK
jgi:hypothetical protein